MGKGKLQVGGLQWILAERVDSQYRDDDVVTDVYFLDLEIGTKTHLASFQDGKWKFPHPTNQRKFFSFAKLYPRFFNTIIRNTQVKDTSAGWMIQWTCFKRRCKFELLKIKRLL
jgi:hypothetical protein